MMTRLLAIFLLCLFAAGCQTGTDTGGALESAAVNDAATDADDAAEVEGEATKENADGTEEAAPETTEPDTSQSEKPKQEDKKPEEKVAEKPKTSGGSDPIADGAAAIAKLRKSKGERVAVETVFACYKKVQSKDVSLQAAQVCAAQDFVLSRDIISRRKPNASGTGDRALLVSKRHPARIGALMQLKGMGQSQFNTFGKYLHVVAEPAYKKALAS